MRFLFEVTLETKNNQLTRDTSDDDLARILGEALDTAISARIRDMPWVLFTEFRVVLAMTPEEMLDLVVDSAREGAEANVASFEEPDDDLLPVLIIGQANGQTTVCGLDGHFLDNQATKDILAHGLMPAACVQFDAIAVAFITSAWIVEQVIGADELDVMPSEHPERKEAIHVVAMTLETLEQWTAPLVRSSNLPPMIGPWRKCSSMTPGPGQGRMADGLWEGLMEAEQARQIE